MQEKGKKGEINMCVEKLKWPVYLFATERRAYKVVEQGSKIVTSSAHHRISYCRQGVMLENANFEKCLLMDIGYFYLHAQNSGFYKAKVFVHPTPLKIFL